LSTQPNKKKKKKKKKHGDHPKRVAVGVNSEREWCGAL
jgi:hypothetical protein